MAAVWTGGISLYESDNSLFTLKLVVMQEEKSMLLNPKLICHFPECILSEWSVFALHYGDKSMAQKGGVFINSFWLLNITTFLNLGHFVPLTQIRWNNVINSLIWKCFCMHRSTALRSLVLIHHHSTLYDYWWPLPRAHPFVFQFRDRRQNAGLRFILQTCQQHHTQLSLIRILIIISPNNLASDTFHNIMWNRSEDIVNKTWWMLLSTTLTLGLHAWNCNHAELDVRK